ncbi:acyl carrier protein [Constrictibacter sp. MBR-5]|jgi:acyl carrier protein|uniref:acyl carrier protein n=1 Tax=Constrictibacter sp. MBR-5 TaxID=3156467 RepID=UPI00339781C0
MTEPLETEIRAFVVENFLFGQDDETLTAQSSLVESGIIDSMGVAEIVAHIESRYGVTVGDDELVPDNLDSIERIAAFVARKKQSQAA